MLFSDYLLFISQAVWVLKSKIFEQFVKNLFWYWFVIMYLFSKLYHIPKTFIKFKKCDLLFKCYLSFTQGEQTIWRIWNNEPLPWKERLWCLCKPIWLSNTCSFAEHPTSFFYEHYGKFYHHINSSYINK